jgi:L-asparaginase
MIERKARIYVRVERTPCLAAKDGPPAPVALIKMSMGDDGRLLRALPDLGYAGAVIEGMGAGHVLAEAAPILGELAGKMPVVLASRAMTGPVFTSTYGYPGAEIDLIKRGLIPAGYLSGLKARLLLSLVMRDRKGAGKVAGAFAPYQ